MGAGTIFVVLQYKHDPDHLFQHSSCTIIVHEQSSSGIWAKSALKSERHMIHSNCLSDKPILFTPAF
jgi:hypothetical protein